MNKSINLILILLVFLLSSCQFLENQQLTQTSQLKTNQSCFQYSLHSENAFTYIPANNFDSNKVVQGQKLYIPFYSQLYSLQGNNPLNFSGTLNIHNTSENEVIKITRVDYFNTSGQLVKQCIEGNHLELFPLATVSFGITSEDDSGGSGANFIVEWVSEVPVSDPRVEIIMLVGAGSRGYSFLTSAQVVEEFAAQ